MRRIVALFLVAAVAGGCAGQTRYVPGVVARGELTLRMNDGFEFWAGGRKVAGGWTYGGLAEHVRCVPPAAEHARAARRDGTLSVIASALGASLAVVALAGGITLAGALAGGLDPKRDPEVWPLVGAGLGVAALATVFAGVARLNKNAANGHAVDAMNYYNDAVGSLGATCDDLVYPPPVAPR